MVRGLQNDLGANPIEFITHATGDWTLRFLLITLAITPLRRILNLPDLIRFRRMLGLWAFTYGCLHLTTWLWLDKFFDLHEMWADVVKRRFITAGMTGFVLMIPLAITSTAGWIRRLGGRNWQRLHRLIYVSAVAGVVHYYWLVKSDIRLPAAVRSHPGAPARVATRRCPPARARKSCGPPLTACDVNAAVAGRDGKWLSAVVQAAADMVFIQLAGRDGERQVDRDAPIAGSSFEIRTEVLGKADGHAAVTGLDAPRRFDLRALLDIRLDSAIAGIEGQGVEAAAHLDMAVSGSGFEGSLDLLGINPAVAGVQPKRSAEVGDVNCAVAGMDVDRSLARHAQLDFDPAVSVPVRLHAGRLDLQGHAVTGLVLYDLNLTGADLPAARSDPRLDGFLVPPAHGDRTVIRLDPEVRASRDLVRLVPIVGRCQAGGQCHKRKCSEQVAKLHGCPLDVYTERTGRSSCGSP